MNNNEIQTNSFPQFPKQSRFTRLFKQMILRMRMFKQNHLF
jgi:hypothetical protein